MKPLSELNQYRDRNMEAKLGLTSFSEHDHFFGCFLIKTSGHPKPLRVIVTRFREDQPVADSNLPWNHISVSLPNRTPTWTEMSFVKDLFFEPDEVAMQLHVAEKDHVSNHEHCLHIWQPALDVIPTPPSIMVGIKELGTLSR
jgi:hypothetical protein